MHKTKRKVIKSKGKRKVGRPAKHIDIDKLRDLSRFMYNDEEVACALGISWSLFKEHKAADPTIKQAIDEGRAKFRGSLRARQINMAMKGDKTMLIWLGKQYLGQKEKVEHGHDPDNPPPPQTIIENYNFNSTEEAAAAFEARLREPG